MNNPKSLQETFTLKNGQKIPVMGFGTFNLGASHETVTDCICHAAELGYRFFDTASVYMNEQGVGEGLRRSGIPREELFVSSKVWNQDQGYEGTIAAVHETLQDMKTDYLDLYLIHWPIAFGHDDDWKIMVSETWRAMTELYHAGVIRALGVSNFMQHHLAVLDHEDVPVMANELERNLGYPQEDIHHYCHDQGIVTISYSPIQGINQDRPLIRTLCSKYGKTAAQIVLRWHLQLGSIPIPRSYNYEHMQSNLEVFDFELTQEEVVAISSLEDLAVRRNHPDTNRVNLDRHKWVKV